MNSKVIKALGINIKHLKHLSCGCGSNNICVRYDMLKDVFIFTCDACGKSATATDFMAAKMQFNLLVALDGVADGDIYECLLDKL